MGFYCTPASRSFLNKNPVIFNRSGGRDSVIPGIFRAIAQIVTNLFPEFGFRFFLSKAASK
jgi:hypothetical protein